MKYIVTGATGFIGYALCKEIIARGDELTIVVRPDTMRKDKLKELSDGAVIIELSLNELDKLHTEYGVEADVFYHLAWNGSSGADRDKFNVQYSNIQYMANAIRVAKACGCTRIIGAGSQAEYGVVKGKAYENRTVPNPFMMYGAAKTASFNMGKILAEQVGIEFVWPRIYSVYGVGENEGTLVSYILHCIRNNVRPELSACENLWNYINIVDCINMLLKLSDLAQNVSGIYHIASNDTRPLRNFIDEIINVTDAKVTPQFGIKHNNPDKTFWLNPDTSKIEALGIQCKVSFADGILAQYSAINRIHL